MRISSLSSFSTEKLLAQANRWSHIHRGSEMPPPALVTVDPTNDCILRCVWCNAKVMCAKGTRLSGRTLSEFARFVPKWWDSRGFGVGAVCIAGGGEPLMNPCVGDFMLELASNGVKVSTVTNGLLIDRFVQPLLANTFVAVSVDAGSSRTYARYKLPGGVGDAFDRVISNIEALCSAVRRGGCNLGEAGSSHGVTYRMLLYRENVGEVLEAARIAKDRGCKNF